MAPLSYLLQFFVVALAGWINQHQRDVIDFFRPRIACSANSSAHAGCASHTNVKRRVEANQFRSPPPWVCPHTLHKIGGWLLSTWCRTGPNVFT